MDTQKSGDELKPGEAADPTLGESLEYKDDDSQGNSGTVISPSSNSDASSANSSTVDDSPPGGVVLPSSTQAKVSEHKHGKLWERVNIYLLLFIFIVIISLVAVAVVYFKNRSTNSNANNTINQQPLSSESLQQLAANGVQVGDPKQVLSIQSNSVFSSTVLVKGELQVAGGLKIGNGGLTIPEVNIGGTAIINNLQTQTLAVAGNTAIQGQLTVQQNLTVNGTGTFNGGVSTPQLTTGRLQLSGDLVLSRHLVTGGSIPGRTNGGSLGSGGTSSLSGSDTAGTITINTGGGAGAGCMVTVNFAQAFSSTPHVSITPIGSPAAGLNYYVNRSGSNFSVCTANAPPSNSSFGFDYIVIE